jgi:hypothetical protein
LFILISGCGTASQPDSAGTVAAYEVPLPTAAEREEFLALLSVEANAGSLHLDASTPDDLRHLSEAGPMTIHAAVWRGSDDEEAIASVLDLPGNSGRAWLSFFRGEDPIPARRFRERAMRKVLERWPSTEPLPILPTGVLPLPADLVMTAQGYRVKPAAAARYGLAASSTFVAKH